MAWSRKMGRRYGAPIYFRTSRLEVLLNFQVNFEFYVIIILSLFTIRNKIQFLEESNMDIRKLNIDETPQWICCY
jgi:hypothetical protein